MKHDVYQEVTDSIVAAIEAGVGELKMPWHRGCAGGIPMNIQTEKEYQGINILNLWVTAQRRNFSTNVWGTYRQWLSRDCQVREGEKSSLIVFYKKMVVKKDEEEKAIPIIRYSFGFNADQVDGYENPEELGDPIERIRMVDDYITATGAEIIYGGASAHYSPREDMIHLPDEERFIDTETSTRTEGFYSTLLHELTHWSGAKHRLNRDMSGKFKGESYAMEELVAELGSAFQCAQLGIESEPREDHAQYIANWLTVLKNDKKAIFTAAARAQEAADYLQKLQHQEWIDEYETHVSTQ